MKLNHPQGILAENQACTFLQEQGCQILHRNWHCPFGEIDIIAKQQHTLLFIEVKYRKNKQFGGAIHSITPSKLNKLHRTIEYYLQYHRLNNAACRLDAIFIEGQAVPQWIKNITG